MNTIVTLSLILGASALSPRSCSFGLTASGGKSGSIGQLDDGQNRIGGGLAAATFTVDNGGIYDAAGRGCILTPSVEQFQCDQGVGPTYGFSIASNGTLEYSGNDVFYACPASDTEWNLYATPIAGQLKCVEITLTASGCAAAASSSCSAKTVTVTVTADNCATSSASETFATSVPVQTVSSSIVTTPASETYIASTTPASTPIEASTAPVVVSSSETVIPIESTTAPVASSETVVPVESTTASAILSSETVIPVESTTTPAVISSGTVSPVESTTTPAVISSKTAVSVESTTAPVATYSTSSETKTYPASSESVVIASTQTIVIASASTKGATSETETSPAYTSTTAVAHTYVSPTETSQASTPAYTSTLVETEKSTAPATPSAETQTVTKPATTFQTYTSSVVIPIWSNTTYKASSSVASATSSASTCVATTLTGSDTSGNYQYPHLIVPVFSTSPTTAEGTQYFGTISSNTSTIFNFDIPSSYAGKICNLIFLLPLQSELETSSYTFSGTGGVEFEQLSSAASASTTYDNQPSVEKSLGEFTLTEGSSTLVESFACAAGETVTYEMSALGDTYLYYFQDWNPSPLGLFITYC